MYLPQKVMLPKNTPWSLGVKTRHDFGKIYLSNHGNPRLEKSFIGSRIAYDNA